MPNEKKNEPKVVRYSPAEIAEYIHILKLNKYNYTKTERDTGVRIKTLKRWMMNGEAHIVLANTREKKLERAARDASEKVLKEHPDYIERMYDAKHATIQRILELIPKEKYLPNLTNLLKTLAEMSGEIVKEDPSINFFQQINNMIVEKTKNRLNGTATDYIEGDQQE